MKKITAEEFDTRFDRGEDVTEFLDMSTAKRPNQIPKTEQARTCKSRTSKQRHPRKSPAHQ